MSDKSLPGTLGVDQPGQPAAPSVEPEHPMLLLMRRIRGLSESLDRAEAAAAEGGKPYEPRVHEAARLLLGSVE